MAAVTVEVAVDQAGERLDRFLAAVLPGHSRSQVQRFIEQGLVTVEGRQPRANLAVREGDRVTVDIPAPVATEVVAEDLPMPALEIGEHLLARQIGAYTAACATDFNFFPRAKVIAVNVEPGKA